MLDFALDIARQAGQLLLEIYARGPNQVASKQSAVDLVTEADLASQQLIVQALRGRFPDHAILAEETPGALSEHGLTWVVDPLDGTTNFAHGYPVFSATLALLRDGAPELGVICDPLRSELHWAERGRGAWCNGRRLAVSTVAELGRSLLATGFPYDRAANPDNNLAEFVYFMPKTRGVRRAGSAALDLAWLAAGRLDGFWERGLNPWDAAAGALMIEEAGGCVTTYAGQPWRPGSRNLLASNGRLHELMLAGLATARRALDAG